MRSSLATCFDRCWAACLCWVAQLLRFAWGTTCWSSHATRRRDLTARIPSGGHLLAAAAPSDFEAACNHPQARRVGCVTRLWTDVATAWFIDERHLVAPLAAFDRACARFDDEHYEFRFAHPGECPQRHRLCESMVVASDWVIGVIVFRFDRGVFGIKEDDGRRGVATGPQPPCELALLHFVEPTLLFLERPSIWDSGVGASGDTCKWRSLLLTRGARLCPGVAKTAPDGKPWPFLRHTCPAFYGSCGGLLLDAASGETVGMHVRGGVAPIPGGGGGSACNIAVTVAELSELVTRATSSHAAGFPYMWWPRAALIRRLRAVRNWSRAVRDSGLE